MGWLVALIAVALFVWLLVAFPRFRIAVGLIVVTLVALIVYSIKSQNDRERQSHLLISSSLLEFKDVTLGRGFGRWRVVGILKNNSAHTLTGLTLKITVRDCADTCVVIGQEDVQIWNVTVPPSQLRSFEELVEFRNMPVPKKMDWNYQIVRTTAEAE